MRALVITTVEPLRQGAEIWGTYWRFRLFLEAICDVADEVEIVHLVADEYLNINPDVNSISAEQSAFLGLPISAHLIGCQPVGSQTLANHYLRGIWSIYEQNEFHWYAGAEQVASVTAFMDEAPDLVFVHRLSAMMPILRAARKPARFFFDLDDIVHRVRIQSAFRRPMRPGKLGHLCQIPAIVTAERRAAAMSHLTFVCSEVDRLRLKRLRFPRVAVVPNAIPIPTEPPGLPAEPTILFLASCDYPPNVTAAERLVRNVFPRVRAEVPEARLLIAGRRTLELASAHKRPPHVEFLGYVEELAPLYASTRLVCCPITSGSGTRVKLIEAAAFARPIVATRFAAEGLNLREGYEILLRDSDETIAAACVRLMKDNGLSHNLGMSARARVQQNFEAAAVRRRIVRLMS